MESLFQFTNPVLSELEYSINQGFLKDEGEIPISLGLSVNVEKQNNSPNAIVELKLEIGEKSVEVPYYIAAAEKASFRWEESLEEEMVNRLLNQNAPSLLLSYLRPIIVQITAASPFGAYNIPFINFTQERSSE